MLGYERNDSAEVTGSHAPKMQVADTIAVLLKPSSNLARQGGVGSSIEQDGARRAAEAQRPIENDNGREEAHYRIHPDPTELAPRDEPGNDKHGNRRIRCDMHKCGAQIMVAIKILHSIVCLYAAVRMRVLVAQKEGAEHID